VAAVVAVAVVVDTELDTRTAVAAAVVQMVLAVLLLQITLWRSALRISKLTPQEQQQPSLTQYQLSRGPIRPGMRAVRFT
jgi:hypothetical protein